MYGTKAWYASKTVWLGILEILIGILDAVATFLATGDLSSTALVTLTSGILTIVLRKLTTQPLE
jgi:hypothetical protein